MPTVLLIFVTTMLLTEMILKAHSDIKTKGFRETIKCFLKQDWKKLSLDFGFIIILLSANLSGMILHITMT